ncbi:hypothetical protein BDY19DRAFT_995416 [Irpex rosettiformis]|uniref:Uncharacterized protein n=1 Tax=Irpex rosettiformis TaxID=378272 RepID=A0ACB8TYC0_9APHY|nr:hypothetical protein BDY19DRAFT_995416 [Irpex rosettiformis]
MSTVKLPLYTPSDRSPSYAAEPQSGEQRLAVARARARLPIASSLSIPTQASRTVVEGIHISLDRQREEDTPVAIYRQDEIVKGEVSLSDWRDIESVTIALEGDHVVAAVLDIKTRDECVLFSHEHKLWRAGNSLSDCPSKLRFAVPFPSTFEDSKGSSSTPPSFSGRYPGPPIISAYISYSLTVVVTRDTYFHPGDNPERVCSEMIFYRPQSRPPLPAPESGPPFMSIVKLSPEDWCQVTTSVPSHNSGVGAIDCHLFIPAGSTYAFDRPIPFQLQLRAPMNHLLAIQGVMPRNNDTRESVFPSTQTAGPSSLKSFGPRRSLSMLGGLLQKIRSEGQASSWVRVYLQRQISIRIYGRDMSQNIHIGEAELTSMTAPDGENVLVWDGRLECASSPNVVTSGFSTSSVEVKDFIVIHIKPFDPAISPWREHIHAHPVHLATHPYQEDSD